MVDGRDLRAALAFVNGIIATDEAEEWENATAFVAVTTTTEMPGTLWVTGPWPDAVTALAWADTHQADLNRGDHDDPDPFVVRVHPVTAPSPNPKDTP